MGEYLTIEPYPQSSYEKQDLNQVTKMACLRILQLKDSGDSNFQPMVWPQICKSQCKNTRNMKNKATQLLQNATATNTTVKSEISKNSRK
jgi:hypothetical protein